MLASDHVLFTRPVPQAGLPLGDGARGGEHVEDSHFDAHVGRGGHVDVTHEGDAVEDVAVRTIYPFLDDEDDLQLPSLVFGQGHAEQHPEEIGIDFSGVEGERPGHQTASSRWSFATRSLRSRPLPRPDAARPPSMSLSAW